MTLLSRLRRFTRRETGAVTVEMVIMLPLIFWPFFMGMESAVMQLRRVMFERAVDVVARDVRMGMGGLVSTDAIRTAVCDEALLVPDCYDNLMLEMEPVDVTTFKADETKTKCVDRDAEVAPAVTFKRGVRNELMMMRFCLLYDPILPGVGIGARMEQQPGGGVAIVAETFYVNEP